MSPTPPTNGRYDVTVYRLLVGSLGLTSVLAVVGVTVLGFYRIDAPSSLPIIAASAISGLAGLAGINTPKAG